MATNPEDPSIPVVPESASSKSWASEHADLLTSLFREVPSEIPTEAGWEEVKARVYHHRERAAKALLRLATQPSDAPVSIGDLLPTLCHFWTALTLQDCLQTANDHRMSDDLHNLRDGVEAAHVSLGRIAQKLGGRMVPRK